MNQLTLFIYLADVLSNVSIFLNALGIILGVVLALSSICFMVAAYDSYGVEEQAMRRKNAKKCLKALWAPSLLLFLVTLIPSKDTMYAMAASEIGEEVLHSPTVTKATAALNAWLDKQTKEIQGSEEEKK